MKEYKYIVMIILGAIITFFPNSLLSMLFIAVGVYITITGFGYFISGIKLIKYRKGVEIDFVRGVLLVILGAAVLFNSPYLSRVLSTLVFILLGLALTGLGVLAGIRSKDITSGIVLIVTGILIAVFPLGVSYLIIRIIGIILILSSTYLFSRSRSS